MLPAVFMLALVWMAVTGSASFANAAAGLLVAGAALFIVRGEIRPLGWPRRPLRIAALALLFLKELALSAWRVAKLVLSPRMDLKPGIFAYELKVERDFEITLLANLITLTPGTLSVDVSDDRRMLFIHAIDCADIEQARRDIGEGFERRILEAFR